MRKRFPQARIDFVVKSEYGELVRYNPNLTTVYEFSSGGGFSALRSLRRGLKDVGYESVIDIHNNLRSCFLRTVVPTGRRIVFHKRFFRRLMLVQFKRNIYRDAVSVADRYIEPLRRFGFENDGEGPEIFIPATASDRAAEFLGGHDGSEGKRIVALAAGAMHETKMWPADRFAELGVKIIGDSNAVLLLGGPADRERNASIREAMLRLGVIPSQIIDSTAKLSLLETASLIDRCAAVVTNDSGLMHIASARKRPVLAIFGPTVREFGFFPIGTASIVIEQDGLSCRPCSYHGGRQCPEGHFRCMKEISTDRVYQSLHTLLSSES